ncbi:MAG: enoyl-CoA hydratase/isomerase family protein [Ferrimicrobium sp.]
MSEVIVYTQCDAIATITIDRPQKRNALTSKHFAELASAFDRSSADKTVRVVVLTGTGTSFSAGADLSDLDDSTDDPYAHITKIHRCAHALAAITKPTIASVNGVAVGAGMNLALGCDLIIAAESAMMSEIFVHRGLTLDFGGSAVLIQRVGLHVAKELAFFGDRITGYDLVARGLVNRVVPDELLIGATQEWANRLAQLPTRSLALTKSLLNQAAIAVPDTLDAEAAAQTVALSDPLINQTLQSFRSPPK